MRDLSLFAALLLCAVLLVPEVALAQDGGRQIGVVDWIYHLPLAIGCAALVIAVDAVVILKFVRRR